MTKLKISKQSNGSSQQQMSTDFSHFACELGRSLREARLKKKLSRRELSELSSVSQRHLVQLEFGSANISIALLYRIAVSLDLDFYQMFPLLKAGSSLASDVASCFLSASKETQFQILKTLGIASDRASSKSNRVALLGVRGGGKTTLGSALAAHFGVPFVEASNNIEILSGMPASEVIELYGIEGFRRYEEKVIINNIETHDSVILAVGGGIVESKSNFDLLLNNYITVWIKAAADEHIGRVCAQGDERPMRGFAAAQEHLESLVKRRQAYFNVSDYTIDTSSVSVQESRKQIIELACKEKFFAHSNSGDFFEAPANVTV